MGDKLAEIEGHVDAGVGATERLAVKVDTQGAVQFDSVPATTQLIGRHENRGERTGRLGLKKAKPFGEFPRDQVAQRHIVGQPHQPDRLARFRERSAQRHIASHDHDFGFHVAAPIFIGQRDWVAGPEKSVRSALIHQRVVPEALGHLCIARLSDERDMVHIGRAVGPLIGAGERGRGIALMKAHHRNGFVRQIGCQVAQRRFKSVPVIERRLKRRRNMGGVCAPGEIIRNDKEVAIAARFE